VVVSASLAALQTGTPRASMEPAPSKRKVSVFSAGGWEPSRSWTRTVVVTRIGAPP
jgi:hypothetical protein